MNKDLKEILKTHTQAGVERALALPQGFLSKKENQDLPETKAMLKILKNFPFILTVADHNFDQKVAEKELKKYLKSLTLWGDINNKGIII